MTTQTNYNRFMSEGQAGMPASGHPFSDDSYTCESAAIPFGRVVARGTADRHAILGNPSGHVVQGISLRDISAKPDNSTPDQANQYENVTVRTAGDVYVLVTGADAVEGTVPKYNITTGEVQGNGGSGSALTGARFVKSATQGNFAIVRLLTI
jgi:hypothetical protein